MESKVYACFKWSTHHSLNMLCPIRLASLQQTKEIKTATTENRGFCIKRSVDGIFNLQSSIVSSGCQDWAVTKNTVKCHSSANGPAALVSFFGRREHEQLSDVKQALRATRGNWDTVEIHMYPKQHIKTKFVIVSSGFGLFCQLDRTCPEKANQEHYLWK